MPETLLSCDWGTTNVRLRRVDVRDGRILDEVASRSGVKAAYRSWKDSGTDRLTHYLSLLEPLFDRVGRRPTDAALVISGMASSSIGIDELPYAALPFRLDGSDLIYRDLASAGLDLPVLLLSGVKSDDDVMRGEETELIGLLQARPHLPKSSTYILPGTHSKHARVVDGVLVAFRTFMTGELFELLATESILRESVHESPIDAEAFERGVRTSLERGLPAALFSVRANVLFKRLSREQNFWYLSGLIVGAELLEVSGSSLPIVLSGASRLTSIYARALQVLGSSDTMVVVQEDVVDHAMVMGHLAAYRLATS